MRLTRDRFDELMQGGLAAAWLIALNAAAILANRLNETDDWVRELLEQEQNARIAESWKRFRESTRGTTGPLRFFHT